MACLFRVQSKTFFVGPSSGSARPPVTLEANNRNRPTNTPSRSRMREIRDARFTLAGSGRALACASQNNAKRVASSRPTAALARSPFVS